jgi:hypothetical protein
MGAVTRLPCAGTSRAPGACLPSWSFHVHPRVDAQNVTGTGLTHLGSAAGRDKMHSGGGDGNEDKTAEANLTDSMKMFNMGLENGKPSDGSAGVQPEWFYKGDGSVIVKPGGSFMSPKFALDGSEEPECVGLYVISVRPCRTSRPCRRLIPLGDSSDLVARGRRTTACRSASATRSGMSSLTTSWSVRTTSIWRKPSAQVRHIRRFSPDYESVCDTFPGRCSHSKLRNCSFGPEVTLTAHASDRLTPLALGK